MKNSFRCMFLFITIAVSLYGQDKILVSVAPEIGTEVDREERDKYNWFQDVPNFISARFYYLQDGTYEIHIQFFQNGQVNEQYRIITSESFQEDYQNTLIEKKIVEQPVRRGKRRRPISHVSKVERNVNLRLKNSIVKDVIITGIAGDSIITEKTTKIGKEIHKTHKNYAIDDIEDVSIIRTIDASKTFAIGVMPGLGAGLHTFIITRDDGLFDDYSREEKAGKILLIGEIIGISVSSSLIAMRNADYDYVLTGLSSEQKSENIGQFITRGLRRKTNPRFSPWVGVYYFRNYLNNSITFPGIRLSLCFTPRSRMEIIYGYSEGWSLENKKFEIQQRGETKKFTNFYMLKIGFRVDQSYHKNLNVFIAWGWGVLWKRFEYSYEYYNQSYQKDIQLNTDIIINLDIGLEHHFNTWLSAEARIGIVENFDYGLHPMVQVGLHLGRFY